MSHSKIRFNGGSREQYRSNTFKTLVKQLILKLNLTPKFSAWVVGKVPNVSPAVPSYYKNNLVTNKQ